MEIWNSVHTLGIEKNKYGHEYDVSNFGNVKNKTKNKLLKLRPDKKGYLRVNLSGKDYKVHRLVAMLFIPNDDEEKVQVNHKNLNKNDNSVFNLEWCSNKENMAHAVQNGVHKRCHTGEYNGRAKLKEKDVLDTWLNDRSVEYIMVGFDMTESSAKALKNKKRWKHLLPLYEELKEVN